MTYRTPISVVVDLFELPIWNNVRRRRTKSRVFNVPRGIEYAQSGNALLSCRPCNPRRYPPAAVRKQRKNTNRTFGQLKAPTELLAGEAFKVELDSIAGSEDKGVYLVERKRRRYSNVG